MAQGGPARLQSVAAEDHCRTERGQASSTVSAVLQRLLWSTTMAWSAGTSVEGCRGHVASAVSDIAVEMMLFGTTHQTAAMVPPASQVAGVMCTSPS